VIENAGARGVFVGYDVYPKLIALLKQITHKFTKKRGIRVELNLLLPTSLRWLQVEY